MRPKATSSSPDATKWTFKLRPNITWHDGTPLTAEHFSTMFGYTKDESLKGSIAVDKIRLLMNAVASVDVPDPATVVFNLSQPTSFFLESIDYLYIMKIADPGDVEFLKAPPIGTGPYQLKEWKPGQGATYQAHPTYYLPENQRWKTVNVRRFGRPEALLPNLESAAVQGIRVENLSLVKRLRDANYQVATQPTGVLYCLIPNIRIAPLDDKRVRQALSYSLNRDLMTQVAFFGVGRSTSSGFAYPGSLAYDPSLVNAYPFDLDRAKALLTEAGVGGGFDLGTIHVWTSRSFEATAYQIWQQDLAKLGITVTLREVGNAERQDIGADSNLKGNKIMPWAIGRMLRDPAIPWSSQRPIIPGQNRLGFQDDQMKDLIAQGVAETDKAKRAAIYKQLNKLWVDNMHIIPVHTEEQCYAWAADVDPVGIDLTGALAWQAPTA